MTDPPDARDGSSPAARPAGAASVSGPTDDDGTAPAAAGEPEPTAARRRRAKIDRLARGVRSAVTFWGRSLRLRVLVLTLLCSSLVIVVLGLVLQRQITDRLLSTKQEAAIAEVENARLTVQDSLKGADPDRSTLEGQLNKALNAIGRPADDNVSSAVQGSTAGVFDPVIVALRTADVSAGPRQDVPADLASYVADGMVVTRYAAVIRDNRSVPALVVGAPATTDTESFGVYLIFPLTGEQKTVDVVQTTLVVAGAALTLAMALIATLVASQVVRPVRRAAAVAERFAGGALDERMPVKGAIELTTMAKSFNGMAEAIRAQIRQLEAFGRLQRRFTSDVSHELRTPVTTVRMAADLLHAERDEFPAHLSRATELLVDELDRFELLLADLLEISRHDAGMAELNAEKIDVRGNVDSCVQAVRPIADRLGVPVVLRMPPDPVTAEIDARRFERILRNLLGNAIDHAEGSPVEVDVAADDTAVAVSVTDHGVGLKPGEASLVFNRFWRADPSRQRQTGGTGLGLAIALEDARLHGGWLQANGAPGQGARFRLTLPRESRAMLTSSPLPLTVTDSDDDEPEPAVPPQPQPPADEETTAVIAGLPLPGSRRTQDVP